MPETKTPASPIPEAKPVQKPKKNGNQKRKLAKLIALALAAVLVITGGVALSRFLNANDAAQGEIYFQPAVMGTIQSTAAGSGSASAKESAAITLTQSGMVQEVFVTGGQTVMAGDPLYTIFSQAAQDEVMNAQAQLDSLREDMNDLLEEANNLTVTAPFAGKLMEVGEFNPGDEVARGTSIATLVNDRTLKLSLYFSYAYEHDIQVGQDVTVTIPAVMGTFPGTVEQINKVSFISPEGAVHFEVVITFQNPGTLTAGMEAAAVLTAADGVEIYPYENGQTRFYETRSVTTKAGGPVVSVGTLLNHANVSAGQALLYLGSDSIDDAIRAKQSEIDAAQLKLEEAQKALENFNATAPIDGTVITCTLTEGAEVHSGDTVVIISNNTTMLVTIQVDDRNISFIKPGDMVQLEWNGMPYMGTVASIDMGGAQAGNGMTKYPVTLTVDNFDGSLMDGAWLQYSFVASQSDHCITVPATSVKYVTDMEGNRQSVVFVQRETRPDDVPELDLPEVEPGMTRQFPSEEEGFYPVIVETGLSNPQQVEIRSGIQEGDQVFVNYMVTDGSW